MISIPHAIRLRSVEGFEEYLETMDASVDSDAVAEALVEALEDAAEEVGQLDDDILALLEEGSESDKGLIELFSDAIENSTSATNSGESLMQLVEGLIEIEWLDADDEADGFFAAGDEDPVDDDY